MPMIFSRTDVIDSYLAVIVYCGAGPANSIHSTPIKTTGTCHCWPSHNSPLVSRVKLALVQAAVVVGVGVGVMVTVHEHVLAEATRVLRVVGVEVVEVFGGLEAERGTVRVVLPEMASTTEDEAVLAETVGSVTPAGVEVRDVAVAATAVDFDDDVDATAVDVDGDVDTTAVDFDDDVAATAVDVDGDVDTTAVDFDDDVAATAVDVDNDVDTTATTDETDLAVVAVAVAPLTVRPSAEAMATSGAVLMVAAVATPLPSKVRVTGSVMFSRARQPRLPACNDTEKRAARKVNRSTPTPGAGLVFPANVG